MRTHRLTTVLRFTPIALCNALLADAAERIDDAARTPFEHDESAPLNRVAWGRVPFELDQQEEERLPVVERPDHVRQSGA